MTVDTAIIAAEESLSHIVEMCVDIGLVDAWSALATDVYGRNLDRYEPEELGDTALSFGIQCSENFKTRALRRGQHDEQELPEDWWDIEDVTVSTRRNSLVFGVGGSHIYVMKVPYAEARSPRWELAQHWEQGSEIRHSLAAESSRVLGGYRTVAANDDPLFPHPVQPGRIKDFLLLWAGEARSPLTSGWLTVPTLGEQAFAARTQLWWDEEPTAPTRLVRRPDRGPDFDQRPPATPEVVVKPRSAITGEPR